MALNSYEENDFRLASPNYESEDREIEISLRPKTLDEYIGQKKVKDNLDVYMKAALLRGEPLDHVLLYGPPGLGKTTLAGIIANTMGTQIRVTSGPEMFCLWMRSTVFPAAWKRFCTRRWRISVLTL